MIPSLFVSHGAPTLALEPTPAHHFLRSLADAVPAPRAIVIVSAHWERAQPGVTSAERLDTIHDFRGFGPELEALRYPARGEPVLAADIAKRLRTAGWDADVDAERGLDHGAWVPLSLAWPDADVPVVQVSLVAGGSAADHYRLGQALSPLREDGVLVMGSGGITHNLRAFRGQAVDAPAQPPYPEFARWISDGLKAGDYDGLLAWETTGPAARDNHPTPEHLLPLFVALGAGGPDATATPLFRGFEYGVLAMEVWRFD